MKWGEGVDVEVKKERSDFGICAQLLMIGCVSNFCKQKAPRILIK